MNWVRGQKETRRLIHENRVLRAQVKMAYREVEQLAMQQEELLARALKLAAFPYGAGDSSSAGFKPQVGAQRRRGHVFWQTSEWTEARRPELNALGKGANLCFNSAT